MKAIQAFGPKDMRIVTLPDPVPGPGQVLVKVLASGICGSDKWLWRTEGHIDRVFGHEAAGEVVGLGVGVQHLKVGDRVAINNVGGCGVCPACRRGAFVLCPQWDGSLDVNGGFGELLVAPERNCMLLDPSIDALTGCLIFDNFGTPYGALTSGNIQEGDDLLISGLGPIGLAAVILAKLRGAYVIAMDPLPYRQQAALGLGADVALAPGEEAVAAIQSITGGLGVSKALECSGKAPAYPLVVRSLRVGGTMVFVGEGGQMDLHPSDQLIRRSLTFRGSWYSTMQQGREVQDLVAHGKIRPKELVTHQGTLEEFPALFGKVCEFGEDVLKAVMISP